ncbi:unnamed protein product [Moneuplotes crassus]|uniref:Uncharacterized protein n=1 Tax=Euplotes crassus TaxID=5936 RepID=A0AAD1XY79_EUPCR|nr:unnamed protein product [Moneuplotes crassus]
MESYDFLLDDGRKRCSKVMREDTLRWNLEECKEDGLVSLMGGEGQQTGLNALRTYAPSYTNSKQSTEALVFFISLLLIFHNF